VEGRGSLEDGDGKSVIFDRNGAVDGCLASLTGGTAARMAVTK
jgi:hypothetical protein